MAVSPGLTPDEAQRQVGELQETVKWQQARIAELESGDELHELRAIVDAQESAMDDQRGIIASQNSLIEELNSQLLSALSLPTSQPEPQRLPTPPETPPPASAPRSRASAAVAAASFPADSRDSSDIVASPVALARSAPRGGVPMAAGPGKGQQQPLSARGSANVGHREQLLERTRQRQLLGAAPARGEPTRLRPSASTPRNPAAPRAGGPAAQGRASGGGIAPRSRSLTARGASEDSESRGTSGTPPGQAGVGPSRKGGVPLPILRQESARQVQEVV